MNTERTSIKDLERNVRRGILEVVVKEKYRSYKRPEDVPLIELEEFARYKKLLKKPISVRAAARKYGLQVPTLSRWIGKKPIPRLGTGPHGAILIDEAHVAYYADKYKANPGRGRRTDLLS